jgi:hypothetical protein
MGEDERIETIFYTQKYPGHLYYLEFIDNEWRNFEAFAEGIWTRSMLTESKIIHLR